MRFADLLRSAIANSFRSKLRTTLTVIAIFIGAFTITLTSAVGTGVSSYIDGQVSTIGGADTLLVTRASVPTMNSGPAKYEPQSVTQNTVIGAMSLVTTSDAQSLRAMSGIASVQADVELKPKWMEYGSGGKYVVGVNAQSLSNAQLAAGSQLDNTSDERAIILSTNDLSALGLGTPGEALGKTVTIGVDDYLGTEHQLSATVVGVQNASLFGGGAQANTALADQMRDAQETGRPASVVSGYRAVTVTLAPGANVAAIQEHLRAEGYTANTVADQLGQFQAVIDGIVGVLNAFGIIALIAAGFGIINTLLMSVQERTREIGLMKAMGMGGGRIYALFSLEAIFIGFLGSVLGAAVAFFVGTALSSVLSATLLRDLPGLNLLEFAPIPVASVIITVMAIAFVAGTIPARRAAKQNPITALRYE